MAIRLAHPAALALVLLVPCLAWLYRFGDRSRRAALRRFAPGGNAALAGTTPATGRNRALVLAAVVVLVLAVAKPLWKAGATPPSKTGDIVFLLDVSRSMLSRDADPSRLARAKQVAGDLAARLRGERAALVTFAGNSGVACPLTVDYDYFRGRLALAAPDTVTRGGTRIGDALLFALDNGFDNVRRGRKVVVLLTDGGDQDSMPEEAAREASRRGVTLVAMGVGDERMGAPVPTSEEDSTPFLYRGQPVRTQLESGILRRIAAANQGGTYLGLSTGMDPGAVYRQFLAQEGAAAPADAGERELSPLLFAIALGLLLWEMLPSTPLRNAPAPLAVVLLLVTATSPSGLVEKGMKAFHEGRLDDAESNFQEAARARPDSPEILFDLANTLYARERYGEAIRNFERAGALTKDQQLAAKCKLGAANCLFRQAANDESPIQGWHLMQMALASYKDALAMDAELDDARYNIGVTEHWIDFVKDKLRAQASEFLVQTEEDKERAKHVEAGDILHEGRPNGRGTLPRQPVDRDW